MTKHLDKRLVAACLLKFCETGAGIAAASYANIGLLGTYPLSSLPYFFFAQSMVAIFFTLFSQGITHEQPQKYTILHYLLTSIVSIILLFLILFDFSGAIFVTCVFLTAAVMRTMSVVNNSVSLAFDVREFRQIARILVITTGIGGLFFALFIPLVIKGIGGLSLIPLFAILYLVCLAFSSQLKPLYMQGQPEQVEQPLKNPFFRFVLANRVISAAVFVLIDFAFKISLQQSFDANLSGMITGFSFGITTSLTILSQIYGMRWFLQQYSIAYALLLFPLCMIIFGLFVLIYPQLLMVAITLGILNITSNGSSYIANQILLNAMLRRTRILANFQMYLFSQLIGRAGIGALTIFLLGEYASVSIVISACIVLGLLAIIPISYIKAGYQKTLKLHVEESRYFQYEDVYSQENIETTVDLGYVVPRIGHGYSIYEAFVIIKQNPDINPIPYLVKDLESSRDIPNFKGRVILLGKLDSKEVESALIKLLNCRLSILPGSIPLTIAIRALNIGLSESFKKEIAKKIAAESATIISLKQALQTEAPEHLLMEIKSRLVLAKRRFFYYLASITNTRSVLSTLPKVLDQNFVRLDPIKRAFAIEYLMTIVEDNRPLRKIFLETMEEKYPNLTDKKYDEVISHDPWLSQVKLLNNLNFGLNMNITEKALFLRRVKLFESLPAEVLELIANSFNEVVVEANKIIFHKGDDSDKLYLVISGIIITKDDGMILREISQFGFFGELGLLDDAPRRASAITKTDAVLLTIHKQEFNQIVEDLPSVSKAIINQLLSYLRFFFDKKDSLKSSTDNENII